MIELMLRDKKSSSTSINLVLIEDIGKPYIGETPFYPVAPQKMNEFFDYLKKNYPYFTDDLSKDITVENIEYRTNA